MDILDPRGFGAVTISKGITIDNAEISAGAKAS
jgi:hypothetical protein